MVLSNFRLFKFLSPIFGRGATTALGGLELWEFLKKLAHWVNITAQLLTRLIPSKIYRLIPPLSPPPLNQLSHYYMSCRSTVYQVEFIQPIPFLRFGLFLSSLLKTRCGFPNATVLLADTLPHSNYLRNAYRHSYYYEVLADYSHSY